VEFTLNSLTLMWTLIVNTAPIFCKFYMKYNLRIKNANMETQSHAYDCLHSETHVRHTVDLTWNRNFPTGGFA